MNYQIKVDVSRATNALNLVYGFFKDKDKTVRCFSISNPLLGDMASKDMIRVSRFKKLLNFIQTIIEENQR